MIAFTPIHPTFGAEVHCADLASLSDAGIDELKAGIAKYGFLVFRDTGLDDDAHVAFSRRFGALDDIRRFLNSPTRPKLRYPQVELFDAGNLDPDGHLLDPDSVRAHQNKGNGIFHADSSYNPRRASYCLLRAVELPPADPANHNIRTTTDFADSRTACEALPDELRQRLADLSSSSSSSSSNGLDPVGAHCIAQSRKLGDPAFYRDLDPAAQPHARHLLVQRHEPSGRLNLYAGAHLHHVEGLPRDASDALVAQINAHVASAPFVTSVAWHAPGDLVMWDNRAVLHRSGAGATLAHRRDMRRTTVHDDSPTAWGLNAPGTAMPGFAYDPKTNRTAGAALEVPPAAATAVVS